MRTKTKLKNGEKPRRGQWNDQALQDAMAAIDEGYEWEEISKYYGIPRSSLRDHMSGKTISRKIDPPPILTKEEEKELIHYL